MRKPDGLGQLGYGPRRIMLHFTQDTPIGFVNIRFHSAILPQNLCVI
jgi:hypothetical protein